MKVCRQIKSDQEVEMIRTSTTVSSKAHEIIIAVLFFFFLLFSFSFSLSFLKKKIQLKIIEY